MTVRAVVFRRHSLGKMGDAENACFFGDGRPKNAKTVIKTVINWQLSWRYFCKCFGARDLGTVRLEA
jgi:hypothetical protein